MCPRKHILGQKWPFSGQTSFILGGSKSSGTYISENHIDNPFAFVFVFTNGSEGQNLAQNDQNAYFGPNLAVLGPKPLFFAFFSCILSPLWSIISYVVTQLPCIYLSALIGHHQNFEI